MLRHLSYEEDLGDWHLITQRYFTYSHKHHEPESYQNAQIGVQDVLDIASYTLRRLNPFELLDD